MRAEPTISTSNTALTHSKIQHSTIIFGVICEHKSQAVLDRLLLDCPALGFDKNLGLHTAHTNIVNVSTKIQLVSPI